MSDFSPSSGNSSGSGPAQHSRRRSIQVEYDGIEYGGLPVNYAMFTNHTVYQRNSSPLEQTKKNSCRTESSTPFRDEPRAPVHPSH